MKPLRSLSWIWANEPAVGLSVCGVLVTVLAKVIGLDLDAAELFAVVGVVLGVGVGTRQLVRPDARAKDEIRTAYTLGHLDHEAGVLRDDPVGDTLPAAPAQAEEEGAIDGP